MNITNNFLWTKSRFKKQLRKMPISDKKKYKIKV